MLDYSMFAAYVLQFIAIILSGTVLADYLQSKSETSSLFNIKIEPTN
jgi:hypothetical protein